VPSISSSFHTVDTQHISMAEDWIGGLIAMDQEMKKKMNEEQASKSVGENDDDAVGTMIAMDQDNKRNSESGGESIDDAVDKLIAMDQDIEIKMEKMIMDSIENDSAKSSDNEANAQDQERTTKQVNGNNQCDVPPVMEGMCGSIICNGKWYNGQIAEVSSVDNLYTFRYKGGYFGLEVAEFELRGLRAMHIPKETPDVYVGMVSKCKLDEDCLDMSQFYQPGCVCAFDGVSSIQFRFFESGEVVKAHVDDLLFLGVPEGGIKDPPKKKVKQIKPNLMSLKKEEDTGAQNPRQSRHKRRRSGETDKESAPSPENVHPLVNEEYDNDCDSGSTQASSIPAKRGNKAHHRNIKRTKVEETSQERVSSPELVHPLLDDDDDESDSETSQATNRLDHTIDHMVRRLPGMERMIDKFRDDVLNLKGILQQNENIGPDVNRVLNARCKEKLTKKCHKLIKSLEKEGRKIAHLAKEG